MELNRDEVIMVVNSTSGFVHVIVGNAITRVELVTVDFGDFLPLLTGGLVGIWNTAHTNCGLVCGVVLRASSDN